MTKEITAGMVVAYTEPGTTRQGWYRVTRATKHKVNLGSIFGRGIYHKGVPKDQVKEDGEAWYKRWQQSETYQCM
jgi:hypothetical protein